MFTNLIGARLRLAAVTLLFSVAFSSAAIAATGALEIKVADAQGNPVAGAMVTASTPDSLTQKSGTTGADGAVRLLGLDPSENYVVTVNAEGYRPQRNEGLLVVTDRTYNVPFTLAVAEGEIEEIITYRP